MVSANAWLDSTLTGLRFPSALFLFAQDFLFLSVIFLKDL